MLQDNSERPRLVSLSWYTCGDFVTREWRGTLATTPSLAIGVSELGRNFIRLHLDQPTPRLAHRTSCFAQSAVNEMHDFRAKNHA